MDFLKRVLDFLPIIRESPPWIQFTFIIWVVVTALLAAGVLIDQVRRPSRGTSLSVDLRPDEYIETRQLRLTGHGLPVGAELEVVVYYLEGNDRKKYPDLIGETFRSNGDGWRYEWVEFVYPGRHEIDVRAVQSGEVKSAIQPVTVVVGQWVAAPSDRRSSHRGTSASPSMDTGLSNEAVDLSPFVVIRDVGAEGTVAAAAMVMAMEASAARSGRQDRQFSLRYVYEKAKAHDELGVRSEGTWLTAVVYAVEQFGAPLESRWPYVPEVRTLPSGVTWEDLDGLASSNRARTFRLDGLSSIPDELKRGRPVVAGVTIYDSSWYAVPSGEGAVVQPPNANETAFGSSAVVFVAFDPTKELFKLANLWGTEWGDAGFAYMSLSTAEKLVDSGSIWAVEMVEEEREIEAHEN